MISKTIVKMSYLVENSTLKVEVNEYIRIYAAYWSSGREKHFEHIRIGKEEAKELIKMLEKADKYILKEKKLKRKLAKKYPKKLNET